MAIEGDTRKRKRRGGKGRARNKSHKDNTITSSSLTTATSHSKQIIPNKISNSSRSNPIKSSNFLDKMKARLSGGHFRMLNEKLYTCPGNEALKFFKEDPSLFNMYHVGYQEQMSHWPELPVNVIIKWLKDHDPSFIVADFGCGDARLSKNVKNKVYSIDLVSSDPSVIACDMSKTPLESSSVDVSVFCLSLMGTDFPSYLQEAHRVLKPRGWLLIAEVKSRFDPNTGGADPIKFSKAICELGFITEKKDSSNKMFILFFFRKKDEQLRDVNEIEWPELKPCLYKRR
ncbi:ribosomal RNA-processing protein 8-like [Chenopodium quinoa]|uniref:ribosomal RNA-processing protein 8-like n=1 Tax=Chenopodium quinoa TaxID=63459 RepID=UPI000B784C07|nr:ribosomal RNA-processing protein 8-like [Chenopodium quinoa]XP_021728518.1 ribosomal RNA-processing protein 8-like [Chenopodium quinoa]